MVKNLQCLKTLQMCYFGHAEHHAKNRMSPRGLDHDTLFYCITPYMLPCYLAQLEENDL